LGLSIAISGGITATALVIIMGIIFAISYQINTESLANTEAFEIQNSLLKTNMDIKSISAVPGVSTVDFVLFNNGSTKLWNYNDFDMLVTYDANIGGVSTRVTESLTFNETASFGGLPSIVFARPDGIAEGGWTFATGPNPCTPGNPFNCIDEVVQDDNDYISTQNLRLNLNQEVNFTLSNLVDPLVDTGHVVSYTYREEDNGASTPDLIVTLFQGVTQIATWTHLGKLPITFTLATHTLTIGEAGIITDYNDLRLGFNGTCNGCPNPGGQSDRVSVSWAELEIPPTINPILGLGSKEWGITNLSNDILDPRLLNFQESASIRVELTYPIFVNGFLEITISSDNGKVDSDSIIVT